MRWASRGIPDLRASHAVAFAILLNCRERLTIRQLSGRDDAFLLDASMFGVMLTGLPWSPSVFVVVASARPGIGADGYINPATPFVDAIMLVPVLANVVIALLVVGSERSRTRAANWFFRFGRLRRRV